MTNKNTNHSDSLSSLKNNQTNRSWLGGFFSKNKVKSRFFLVVTITLLLSIFGINLLYRVDSAAGNIQANQENILNKLASIREVTNISTSDTLYEIKKELIQSISPINNFLFVESLVDRDVDKILDLSQVWIDALQPLSRFEVGPEGLVDGFSNNSFTAELEIFFDKLPELNRLTNNLYNDFWHYRTIIRSFGADGGKEVLDSIKEFLDLLDIVQNYRTEILELLGHFTTKQIVVFNQNTGEARATGGFYGSYLPVTISQGQIKVGQSQSIYYVDGSKPTRSFPHPAYRYYGFGRESSPAAGATDLNFTPCFPVTARLMEQEFANSRNGYTIDHLVVINPALIQSILPDDYVISVDGVGTINKDNFLLEVERLTSLGVQFSRNPKYQISNIFRSIIDDIGNIISQNGAGNFLLDIVNSIQSRYVQIWFKDSRINELFSVLNLYSDAVCHEPGKNIITPVMINFSGDKRNLVSSNFFSINSDESFGQVDFRVKFQEYIPPKTFLQRGFNSQTGQMFIGLQLPTKAANFAVASESILFRDFPKPFSKLDAIEQKPNVDIRELPEAEIINLTGRNMTDGGITYTQYDGSVVLGAFISSRAGFNEIEFSFSLPIDTYEKYTFYGQPGMNNPSLSLGDGVRSVKHPHTKTFNNPQQIQRGVELYSY